MSMMDAVLSDDPSDAERYIARATLKYAVQRQIQCKHTRAILDVRRSVLITVSKNGRTLASECVDGDHYDKVAGNLTDGVEKLGAILSIIDGRKVNGRKKK